MLLYKGIIVILMPHHSTPTYMSQIKVKAMCIIRHQDKLLVCRYFDNTKQQYFYRLLGGSMEFGETAEETMRREIKEEINSELEDLRFLQMVENVFTYENQPGHEVIFLFSGTITRTELYEQTDIIITEPTEDVEGFWVPIENILHGDIPLYPLCDYRALLAR